MTGVTLNRGQIVTIGMYRDFDLSVAQAAFGAIQHSSLWTNLEKAGKTAVMENIFSLMEKGFLTTDQALARFQAVCAEIGADYTKLLDEPVVQRDETFYMNHDALGGKNVNGAIFLDSGILYIPSGFTPVGFFRFPTYDRQKNRPFSYAKQHDKEIQPITTQLDKLLAAQEKEMGDAVFARKRQQAASGPIREAGGLLSLRALTESKGGRMVIESAPAFRLVIFLPAAPETSMI